MDAQSKHQEGCATTETAPSGVATAEGTPAISTESRCLERTEPSIKDVAIAALPNAAQPYIPPLRAPLAPLEETCILQHQPLDASDDKRSTSSRFSADLSMGASTPGNCSEGLSAALPLKSSFEIMSKALRIVNSQPNSAGSSASLAKGSQAEGLMQDLTKMRLIGRGGSGSVYEVGHASKYGTVCDLLVNRHAGITPVMLPTLHG